MAADCRRYIAWYHSPTQVIYETWRAAGLPPLRSRWLANVFNQRISETDTSVALITVNCQLSTVNSLQLPIVNCQFSRSGLLQQVLILLKRIHHALHYRAPEASRFQGFDAHDGAAAGGADGVFQGAGVLAGGQEHFRGTG